MRIKGFYHKSLQSKRWGGGAALIIMYGLTLAVYIP